MRKLKVCRTCTNHVRSMGAVDIFDPKQTIILKKIKTITGIELCQSKQLPNLICFQCQLDLNQAYEFHTRFMSAQEYFSNSKKPNSKTRKAKVNDKSIKEENGIEDLLLSAPVLHEKLLPIKVEEINSVEETMDIVKEPLEISEAENNEEEFLELDEAVELRPQLQFESVELSENVETCEIDVDCENTTGDKITERKSKKKTNTKSKSKLNEKQAPTRRIKSPTIFVCELCGNHLKDRYSFVIHQKRHKGEIPHECEFCPMKFTTTGQLKAHMRKHTGERHLPCKYCDRRFADYSSRIRHERTHTNERPFVCRQCGSAFTTSYTLKNHFLTHSNERAYKCELCDKSFKLPTHLSTHIQTISHQQKLKAQKQKID